MDTLTALALTTGVLIAIWTFLSVAVLPDLSPWVGLAAWGCFFAAGGKTQGFQKTVFASLSGLVYVWVMMQLLPRFGGSTLVYAILIGAIAFLMVVQSKVPPLSFIPGAFIGAAVTVGSGGGADLNHLLYMGLSLVAGAALGFASETVAGSLAKQKR
jgi:hypothetical protein